MADDPRTDEIRLHADALCRCIWCDHLEEADYHRRVLDLLEHGQDVPDDLARWQP